MNDAAAIPEAPAPPPPRPPLLPAAPPRATARRVRLSTLPPDAELVGPPPDGGRRDLPGPLPGDGPHRPDADPAEDLTNHAAPGGSPAPGAGAPHMSAERETQ